MAGEFASVPVRLLRDLEIEDKYRNAANCIYLAIQRRAFECGCAKGGEFEISYEWITALTGFKRTWTWTVMRILEERGYLRITRRSGYKHLLELLPETRSLEWTGDIRTVVHSSELDPFTGVNGLAISPLIDVSLRKEEGTSPSSAEKKELPPRQRDLFNAPKDQPNWIRSGVEFLIDEIGDPKLNAVRGWIGGFLQWFFGQKGFRKDTDVDNALTWARHLAKCRASEMEAREAADWLLFTPPINARTGEPIFGRDTLRFALVNRILEQRRRAASNRTEVPARATAPVGAEDPAEAERKKQALERLRAKIGKAAEASHE